MVALIQLTGGAPGGLFFHSKKFVFGNDAVPVAFHCKTTLSGPFGTFANVGTMLMPCGFWLTLMGMFGMCSSFSLFS